MRKMLVEVSKEVGTIIFSNLMQGLRKLGPCGHQLQLQLKSTITPLRPNNHLSSL
jgi:hypothetical protein